jgi:hypothetical protein
LITDVLKVVYIADCLHVLCKQIAFAGSCDPTVDVALVLDSSTSVSDADFRLMEDFAKQLVFHSSMDEGHQRFAALTVSSRVEVLFHLNHHRSRVSAFWALDGLQHDYGSMSMANALWTLRNGVFSPINGDRPEASNIAVIITNRDSSLHHQRTLTEARLLHEAGVLVYVVGIGLRDSTEVQAIASSPVRRNAFLLNYYSELSTAWLRERLAFCNRNSYPPPGTA